MQTRLIKTQEKFANKKITYDTNFLLFHSRVLFFPCAFFTYTPLPQMRLTPQDLNILHNIYLRSFKKILLNLSSEAFLAHLLNTEIIIESVQDCTVF